MTRCGLRVDYHTHHVRCGHAVGTVRDYVMAGISAGLHEIGMSAHVPPITRAERSSGMPREQLPSYVTEVAGIRQEFAGTIDVRVGVEADVVPEETQETSELLRTLPLDYVIGSVHWVGSWNIYDRAPPALLTKEELYGEYLHLLEFTARSGEYDIIGHLDGLNTMGHMPEPSMTPMFENTLRVIAASGIAVEVNTSGWRKPCQHLFPRAEIIRRCVELQIPLTMSSDAHTPSEVAYRYPYVFDILMEAGCHEIATFSGRRMAMRPLWTQASTDTRL